MRNLLKILTLVLAPICACHAVEPRIIGSAYALDSEELLYRELHYFSGSNSQHRVIYAGPEGDTIAEKTLDYSFSLTQPEVKQSNALCGEEFSITNTASDEVTIDYKENERKTIKSRDVKRPDNLVVDAGFDFLVKGYWEKLLAGENIEFDYLVPSRLRAYEFKLSRTDCTENVDGQCFNISPAPWYLRLLLDPIVLAYNQQKQLIGFKGLGNIADQDCKYMKVNIRYQYLPDTNGL